VIAGVEEESGELDVALAGGGAFDLVEVAAEADEGLFHALVFVVPGIFGGGAEVAVPAVGEFAGGVEEAGVFPGGEAVVADGGFEEIAGNVAFVVGAACGVPVFEAAGVDEGAVAAGAGEREGGLEVAVGFLCAEDDGDPLVEGGAHEFVGCLDFGVAVCGVAEGEADGLDGLVDPGVGEDVAFVAAVGLAAELFAGFDEVIDTAGADFEVVAVDLADAMGDPVDAEAAEAGFPKRAGDFEGGGFKGLEGVGGGSGFDVHLDGGCGGARRRPDFEAEDVAAGGGEGGGGVEGGRVGKADAGGSGGFGPFGWGSESERAPFRGLVVEGARPVPTQPRSQVLPGRTTIRSMPAST
jgi:hypothetical protein